MAYATIDDVVKLYGNRPLMISADRNRDGIVDLESINTGLESASAEIDSYLGIRYRSLPLANPSSMLRTICIDIFIYRMSNNEAAMTEEIFNRYKAAIDWLKLVAKGDVSAEAVGNGSSTGSGGAPTGPVQPGIGGVIVPSISGPPAGLVTALTLVSGGSGYLPATGEVPLIFAGGDGYGAQGRAVITGGVITGVKLDKPGGGYKTLPIVTIGLSGATLDPSHYPPTVTGGKRAGMFFSQNRQEYAISSGLGRRRTWPT
jgi:phage gp36-like protein